MKHFIICILLSTFSVHFLFAQRVDNYDIKISKRTIGDNVSNIECSFDIFFDGQDSVALRFGGNFNELTFAKLRVRPRYTEYRLVPKEKKLVIFRFDSDSLRLSLKYSYRNMSTALICQNGENAEIWDMSYSSSGEFFYPIIPGNENSYCVRFNNNVKTNYILSCPNTGRIKAPIAFVVYNKKKYCLSEKENCRILQDIEKKAASSREEELDTLTQKSISFYESIFEESYASSLLGTSIKPLFFFYVGEDTVNRYNNGFISASQRKFSTHPSILPLAHEIGHRWLGEYTILCFNAKGYAFLVESLNEFMTWQFVKKYYGEQEYYEIIDKARDKVKEFATNNSLQPICTITTNNNWVQTYYEGPLLLHEYSKTFGDKIIIDAIVKYYKESKYKSNGSINEFIDTFGRVVGKSAAEEMYKDLSSYGYRYLNIID